MTEKYRFEDALARFLAMPFPGSSGEGPLREWISGLFDLDAGIAGYATQVRDGDMPAEDIPFLPELISDVHSLRTSIDRIDAASAEGRKTLTECREYILILTDVVDGLSA